MTFRRLYEKTIDDWDREIALEIRSIYTSEEEP